jgi:plastocyanin
MPKNFSRHQVMAHFTSIAAGGLTLILISGLVSSLPFANAQSTVVVSIPNGTSSLGASAAPGYKPSSVTVVIGVNNTVMWANNDTANHTVTPGNEPAGATWSVGSGDMAPKAVYSFTFTVPGTYTYSCAYHNFMSGTVVVKAAAVSTATSTSTSTTTPTSIPKTSTTTSATTTSASTTTTSTTTTAVTSTTPEFPAASLAAVFFAVIAALLVAAPRVRPDRVSEHAVNLGWRDAKI